MSVTVSYIPAIHEGYLQFLTKYPHDLYVLNEELIKEVPRLDRDIRALKPSRVVTALASMGVSRSVQLLNLSNLDNVRSAEGEIVLPNESANRTFAEKYLQDLGNLKFVDAFLRWDMLASLQTLVADDDDPIEMTDSMRLLMELAEEEASKSPDWWRQVGAAVLTRTGEITASHNTHLPSPDYSLNAFGDPRANFDAGERIEVSKAVHAEARLIAQAARSGQKLEDATMLVTTFPCPACAKLIAEAGIKEVIYKTGYSLLDAKDTFNAYGVSLKRVSSPLSQHEP